MIQARAATPGITGRVVRRARHAGRLASDVWWMARVNRMWWLLPLLALAVAAVAAGAATHTVVPYTVYTLL